MWTRPGRTECRSACLTRRVDRSEEPRLPRSPTARRSSLRPRTSPESPPARVRAHACAWRARSYGPSSPITTVACSTSDSASTSAGLGGKAGVVLLSHVRMRARTGSVLTECASGTLLGSVPARFLWPGFGARAWIWRPSRWRGAAVVVGWRRVVQLVAPAPLSAATKWGRPAPGHRRANRRGHRQRRTDNVRGAQQHLPRPEAPFRDAAESRRLSGEYHPADVTRVVLCIHGIRTDAYPIPWRQELDAALRLEGSWPSREPWMDHGIRLR